MLVALRTMIQPRGNVKHWNSQVLKAHPFLSTCLQGNWRMLQEAQEGAPSPQKVWFDLLGRERSPRLRGDNGDEYPRMYESTKE